MSESKHTPGPWTAEPHKDGRYTQWEIRPDVASVFYVTKTGEANAHLIAAAPDLLEALKELQCWVHQHDRKTPAQRGCKCDFVSGALAKCAAAIAKAQPEEAKG